MSVVTKIIKWSHGAGRMGLGTWSEDLMALARAAKKPRLTPGPEPSSPSNLTRI